MPQKPVHQIAMIALRRPGQRRLRPGPRRPAAVGRHGGEFHQDLVHEGLDVGKRIPGRWNGLCGTGGGAHMLQVR
jgi:hypothetical protein